MSMDSSKYALSKSVTVLVQLFDSMKFASLACDDKPAEVHFDVRMVRSLRKSKSFALLVTSGNFSCRAVAAIQAS